MILEILSPHYTQEEAEGLARRWLEGASIIKALPSYIDQNFLVAGGAGRRYVLKVANAAEQRAVLDLQNQAMTWIAMHHPAAGCPEVVPDRQGDLIATLEGPGDNTYFARMVTYIPGTLFADVNPHPPALLRGLGAFLGKLDAALEGFTHPAMQRDLVWDLRQAPRVRPLVEHLGDASRQALVERFLDLFDEAVVPAFSTLRQSVIHNDANDYNVLVRGSGLEERRVSGIIDFGDLLHTFTVCEVAIAAAYAMLGSSDPLAAASDVVAGYHSVHPLTEGELRVLFPLICARYCISVTTSSARKQLEPDKAYLSVTEAGAWAMLETLSDVPPALAYYTFREACGLAPCPQTASVVAWLERHAGAPGKVVEPEPKTAGVLEFDLSVGSPLWAELNDPNDVDAAAALFFGKMQRVGAALGVGRYDEARPVYVADQYRAEGREAPERRTIHLGVDLFQRAGSPVFAPLDGIVYSVADNAQPLDYGPTIILRHEVDDGIVFYTLYGHLSRASLKGLKAGRRVRRGERIGALGSAEENGGWVPHLHFQLITDILGERGNFPGVAAPGRRALWLSLCPDPNLILQIPEERFAPRGRASGDLIAARRKRLGPSLSLSYRAPLKIVRGRGAYLYDEEGRAFLDGVNNVCHVGHCHPHVVRAAASQMALLNTNTRYLHDHVVRYAERLAATLPHPLSVCFFVNSGSEANDLALRMARTHTGRRGIICVDGAYHGNLTSLVEISPYKFDGPGGQGAPEYVRKAPMPDPYRGPYRGQDAGVRYAAHLEEPIQSLEEEGVGMAAFIAESILSCGGQVVPPEGYLEAAYRAVRAAGGACIADEVQVGFGRVGSHFWGFEAQGVVPDIVTMGKPIGNGHPLGAVVTTPEIAASFNNGMEYFNTYGGNPVSCAVGLAVLDVIEAEGLQGHAAQVGKRLMGGLSALKKRHPIIGDVRGLGLFVGIELVLDRETLAPAAKHASHAVERMKAHGILLSTDGPLHNVIKIKPPLAFSEEDADHLVATLDAVLAEDAFRLDAAS